MAPLISLSIRAVLLCVQIRLVQPFVAIPLQEPALRSQQQQQQQTSKRSSREKTSGFEDSENASSKSVVSAMTRLVNSLSPAGAGAAGAAAAVAAANSCDPPENCYPTSPHDLLERIRDDYVVNNYLWTGDINLSVFAPHCRFTDPTLSFEGTDTFVKNIKNLRPIVDFLTRSTSSTTNNKQHNCRSDLLDIELKDGYIQTRWNMVGSLEALPWKPRIDVIGQTKFWYDVETFKVYFYDEVWEIPAGKALLQLVSPPGAISNTSLASSLRG